MRFSSGMQLGHYEVVAPLGAGGMGEVYLARDTRLGREVAIKVLSQEFARDAERLARFEREARVLAQLKRFLFIQSGAEQKGAAAPQVHIVLEWFEDIRRRVRAGG